MEKLTINILDKKALKKLQELVNKKLIEIHREPSSHAVDWEKYSGSLPKAPIAEIEKEIAEFRNWEQ
jgi:histone H3/H4